MGKLKVLVAESQTVVKQQLTKELEKDLEIAVVGATDNGKMLLKFLKEKNPISLYLICFYLYTMGTHC